jgi:hypothetical protein
MNLTKSQLREIIREEVQRHTLTENIFKTIIQPFKTEFDKWKQAYGRAFTYGTPTGRQTTLETVIAILSIISLPILGPIFLGKSLYTKAKNEANRVKRDKELSKEERQKELFDVASEIYESLPAGRKRYVTTLLNRVTNTGGKDISAVRDLEDYISKHI